MLAYLADIHADRVAEQHQHQGERRDHLERRRIERELDQPEPGRAQRRAQEQEDGHLRQSRALDRAREQRRDDDDDADEGERGGEAFVGH